MTFVALRRDLVRALRAPARPGVPWSALALLPVVLLAAVLIWQQAGAPQNEVLAVPPVDEPAPPVLALPTLTELPTALPDAAALEAPRASAEAQAYDAARGPDSAAAIPTPLTGQPAAVTPPAPAAVSAPAARPPALGAPAQVVRVRIPALGVDAPVQSMGLDAAGAMEVPYNAATVAWYGFTAAPGTPGNAVMSGHVDYGGARAVFWGIRSLRTGDVIEVATSEGSLRYSVERTYLVRPEEADIDEIVGRRQGPETLTLITCGGTFDRSRREYDHRVVVRATRL